MSVDLEPTFDFEKVGDRLRFPIYDQTGKFVYLMCEDTPHNRRFIVWLRKFDRAGPKS
jgi:hypothetical protein